MTTLKLMEATLRKLDRPTDTATVTLYKERLLGYLNEALLDLTAELRPWRRDTVTVTGGQAELSGLPHACLKVLAARVDGQRRLFYYGSTRGTLLFPGMEDGTVELTYRYQPALLSELTDKGDAALHGVHPPPGLQQEGGVVADPWLVFAKEIVYLFHNVICCLRWVLPIERWYFTVPEGMPRMADISLKLRSSK